MPILYVGRRRGRASALGAAPEKLPRAFIDAATAAGAKAEMLVLPEVGIKGNTHMLMQDDNSLDIADILIEWIDKHVTTVE